MAKSRHKHYRKVKQSRFQQTAQAQPDDQSMITAPVEAAAAPNTQIMAVKHDLRLTSLTTLGLLLLLMFGAYLNTKYHWTLHFGDALYSLLHIR
jgi:hypothetical protein